MIKLKLTPTLRSTVSLIALRSLSLSSSPRSLCCCFAPLCIDRVVLLCCHDDAQLKPIFVWDSRSCCRRRRIVVFFLYLLFYMPQYNSLIYFIQFLCCCCGFFPILKIFSLAILFCAVFYSRSCLNCCSSTFWFCFYVDFCFHSLLIWAKPTDCIESTLYTHQNRRV